MMRAAPDQNKATFQLFVEAVNTHDLDALDALMLPDFVRHCQATAPLVIESLEAFKAFLRQDRGTFPDARLEAHRMVAEDDLIAVYATFTGTQEGPMGPFMATGKQVTAPFLGMLRFEAGKIAEMWVEWDNFNLLTKLGHFSPPPDAGSV